MLLLLPPKAFSSYRDHRHTESSQKEIKRKVKIFNIKKTVVVVDVEDTEFTEEL